MVGLSDLSLSRRTRITGKTLNRRTSRRWSGSCFVQSRYAPPRPVPRSDSSFGWSVQQQQRPVSATQSWALSAPARMRQRVSPKRRVLRERRMGLRPRRVYIRRRPRFGYRLEPSSLAPRLHSRTLAPRLHSRTRSPGRAESKSAARAPATLRTGLFPARGLRSRFEMAAHAPEKVRARSGRVSERATHEARAVGDHARP